MRSVAVISGKYRVVSVSRGTLVLRKEPYLMKVFVLSQQGTPLMPTTPRRARLWLKAKRARVLSRDPFTIQLRFETTHYTQPVTVGVDTGSQTVGVAATTGRGGWRGGGGGGGMGGGARGGTGRHALRAVVGLLAGLHPRCARRRRQ